MKRLDHTLPVVDFQGETEPMLVPDADGKMQPTGKPTTYRDLAMIALQNEPRPPQPPMAAEKKARIFGIITKFYRGRYAKLTVDEAALLKEQAGEALTAVGYGRLCEWLEGEPPFIESDDDDDIDASEVDDDDGEGPSPVEASS